MKLYIIITLSIIQILSIIIGTTLMIVINLNNAYKDILDFPCILLFTIGLISFTIIQILLHKWNKNK